MGTTTEHERSGLAGSADRPIQVTFVGAGSMFCPRLCRDILLIPQSVGGQFRLVDIDADRLSTMKQLVETLVHEQGLDDQWQVQASTDLAEILPGSDYVICCIEVAGIDCVAFDNDIPRKYGVDQCIGDTIGPGGLFKALRTVPIFLDIIKDVSRLAPQAIVLNYTNPMNMMCLAAGRLYPQTEVFGLCHSVQSTSRKLAEDAQVPYDQLVWACAGINHLAWFTTLEHERRDLYPNLIQKVQDRKGDVYESDPVRYDMMMHFGAFITESSGHLSEYLPYYRTSEQVRQAYCRDGYRGGSRFYADNWPNWRRDADLERQDMLAGRKQIELQRSYEYASWIIEAREKGAAFEFHGNVMNRTADSASLITNLSADGCVEVVCAVDRFGVHPQIYGTLPPQMAHICASNMAMFDLGATACIERSKEAAIHALLLDPLTAAVCCPVQIKQMALDLFEAESDYLPGFQ